MFIRALLVAAASATLATSTAAQTEVERPNILVIWGDDIGWQNVSAYGMGTMGYTTPNIDRIGVEGIRFTDHYAPAVLHGRAGGVHHRAISDPLRHDDRRRARRPLGLQAASPVPRRGAEDGGLRAPDSSARTTSATATSTCRPSTASTSSSAISTT